MNVNDEDVVLEANVKGVDESSCAESIKEDVVLAKITRLELEAQHHKDIASEKIKKLEELEKEVSGVKTCIAQIESGMQTFKYTIGVIIALTGGVGTFVVTELIKII